MIGKGIFGKSFGTLLRYVEDGRKSEGVLGYTLGSGHRLGPIQYANLAARTPERAAAEMRLVANRSTRVEKPVFHLIVALHPSESEDSNALRLQNAALEIVRKLGLSEHQAVYAVHMEKKHLHCHVAINRVGPNGRAWEMWRSARRIEHACREVEIELGFRPHQEFQKAHDCRLGQQLSPAQRLNYVDPGTWSTKQRRVYEQTGRLPQTMRPRRSKFQTQALAAGMREKIAHLFEGGASWSIAMRRLRDAGFDVELVQTRNRRGLRIIRRDGKAVPASAIDRKFSLANLESRWGEFPAELCRSAAPDTQPGIPRYVVAAHAALEPLYASRVAAVRDKRKGPLAALRLEELQSIAALRQTFIEDSKAIRSARGRVEKDGITALYTHCLARFRTQIRQLRARFTSRRKQILSHHPLPKWVDFVVQQAKKLVQAAVSILAWLRRHRDRTISEHRILPRGLCTPPEVFEHFRFTPKLIEDTGCVLYTDDKNRPAFIDRGDDIVVLLPQDRILGLTGNPDFLHVGAALRHADGKWGSCNASGRKDAVLVLCGGCIPQIAQLS